MAENASKSRRQRVAYLDNLKLLLVAVIIAGHGAVAYGGLESAWPYQDIQEVQLSAVSDAILSTVVIAAALFAMGLFFLVSGLITPGSIERKGTGRFARDRLVRLGVPLLVWVLILWPGAIWLAHTAAGDDRSFWWQVTHGDPFLDTGPMWFVAVLLIYSLVYAGWYRWGRRAGEGHREPDPSTAQAPLTGRWLVLLAAGISVATILVRPVFPAASGQIGQSHVWQWPQFIALFGLGIVAAQRGWLDPVPERLRVRCGVAALCSLAAFLIVAGLIAVFGVDGDVIFEAGIHWPTIALGAVEGPLVVGASLWLLGFAQLKLAERPGPFGRAMVRSAYGAFLLQGIVLIGLMVAMRPIDLPAEVKALMVAGLGVAGSFSLSWLLVSRTPVGRVI